MSENQEIEAKYLLTSELYQQLLHAFPSKQSFSQANYYYDTPDFNLRAHFCGLRIRTFKDHAEETMKVPDPAKLQNKFHEVMEINDKLALQTAKDLVKEHKLLLTGQVGAYLKHHFADSIAGLQQFSWSKTQRCLVNGPSNCELTLDETQYPDGWVDFELEIENHNPQTIQRVSELLQQQFNFHPGQNECNQNKIDRATQHRLSI
jgi:uncharacterized protein YjbK